MNNERENRIFKSNPRNIEDALYHEAVDVCIACDGDLVVCNTFIKGCKQREVAKLPVSEVFIVVEDSEVIDLAQWGYFVEGEA